VDTKDTRDTKTRKEERLKYSASAEASRYDSMVAFAAMRLVIVLLASGGIAVSTRASDAQSIRVATPTEVVRETDPRRFSEPCGIGLALSWVPAISTPKRVA